MKPGQEAEVVSLIRALIDDYGTSFKSGLTEQALKDSLGFLRVDVAEENGRIIGLCAWVITFSTWRGIPGMYIADHVVVKSSN